MPTNYRKLLYKEYFSNQSDAFNEKLCLVEDLKHRSYYINDYLKSFLPDDKKSFILDIGCGYGAILSSLKSLGYSNFLGVDSSKEAIDLLQSTDLSEHIVESDIICFLEKSVKEESKWDTILLIDILEHFTKDELVNILGFLILILNPAGRLIIKVPNVQSPLGATTVFGDFTHETYFTPTSLSQLLNACGFRKVESFEAAPVPYTLASSIRSILWKMIRLMYTFSYAVETGSFSNSMIWTRSFFAIARRD